MPMNRNRSIPEVADRHRRLVAYSLLALGVQFAARVVVHFVDPGLGGPLNVAADALALVAVGLVVPIMVWKARNASRAGWHLYQNEDGFVAQTLARAQGVSWVTTFLVLVLLNTVDALPQAVPASVFFDAVLALMILTFAGTYFYLDRSPPAPSGQ